MAAMNIPGGGKNDIPNRLKRQFSLFHVPLPSPAAITNIFGALVQVSSLLCVALGHAQVARHPHCSCLPLGLGWTSQLANQVSLYVAWRTMREEGRWQVHAGRCKDVTWRLGQETLRFCFGLAPD